jgi:hypothetical protein
MNIRLFVALLLLLPFSSQARKVKAFYVKDQQYRFSEDDPRCSVGKLCTSEPDHGYGDHDFSLNFVEFKDNGTPFDKGQLPAALEQIRAARANSGKTVVFIYIHGWHNGAEERTQGKSADCAEHLYDGDVAKFRNCGLKIIADDSAPSSPGAPPRVVGIYLAWHGTDFGWPPFSYVPSYPIRRHFARSVGLSGMAEALQSIFSVIQEQRDSYFVIAMGHSFGARVLEAADEFKDTKHPEKYPNAGIIEKVRSQTASRAFDKAKNDRLPVNLIFYVNAATSSYLSIQTIQDWKSACTKYPLTVGCGQDPLYLGVSSRADVLTAIVMPVANIVFFAPWTDGYHIISAANTPWMQTHSIPRKIATPPATHSRPSPADLPQDTFCFAIPITQAQTDYYEVDTKSGKTPAMFWDMNTDHWDASLLEVLHVIPGLRQLTVRHWVISSHGDVWNTGVFNLVHSVITTAQKKATCDPPAQQRPVLKK